MRLTARIAMLGCLWSLLPPAAPARGATVQEERIRKLMAEAKYDQAERALKAWRPGGDPTPRRFCRIDLLRGRARMNLTGWTKDKKRTDLRGKARDDLLEALSECTSIVKAAESKMASLERRVRGRDVTKDAVWRRMSGYAARSNYCEAWVCYDLARLTDAQKQRKGYLDRAVEKFNTFTGGGYQANPIVADCFLGQALCHFEMRDYFQVAEDLKEATIDNTPAMTFKRMTYLRIKASQSLGSPLGAETAAKQYFDALPEGHKHDGIELGMVLARARSLSLLADPKTNPEYHKLFRKRFDDVARLLYSHGEPWRTQLAKIQGKRGGITPFGCLAKARQYFTKKNYSLAAVEADKGLAAAEKTTQPTVLADLRYIKAAVNWNLRAWRDAHVSAFAFVLHHASDRRAEEMCRRALQAGLKAVEAEPKLDRAQLLKFFDLAEKRFGSLEEMRKLPWYRANFLLKDKRYARAAEILKAVPPESPVYLLAQYGLTLAAHKRGESAEALDETAAAVGRFLDAAAGAGAENLTDDQRRAASAVVDMGLATAQRYLNPPHRRAKATLTLLDRIEKYKLLGDRAATRRAALRIQANVLLGNTDAAAKLIETLLAGKGADAKVGAAALAAAAEPMEKEHDRLVDAGETKAADELAEKIVAIYAFLLRHVTSSADTGLRAKEAAVRYRLARFLEGRKRYAHARPHYQWLVDNTPRRKAGAAIRGLAVCGEESGKFADALAAWRILVGGLKKNSEGWYEARYHVIRCYWYGGQAERAKKVLAYFLLQHPRIEPAIWRERFRSLAKEMKLPAADKTQTPVGRGAAR